MKKSRNQHHHHEIVESKQVALETVIPCNLVSYIFVQH